MAFPVRFLVAAALFGVVAGGVALSPNGEAAASTPRVVMYDNDGPLPSQGGAIDFWTGELEFAPHHIAVMKGEQVVFDNPAGNKRPHNVVSISNSGNAGDPKLDAGAKFTSGLNREAWLSPGASWTLDTSTVDPGHYSYFCSIHPWMVGSITVLPAAQ
jgi:plastocyanin